jgi:hypothetical protein
VRPLDQEGTCVLHTAATQLSCAPSGAAAVRYFVPNSSLDAFLKYINGDFTAN